MRIALKNDQVTYIMKDRDVKGFYEKICEGVDEPEVSEIEILMGD